MIAANKKAGLENKEAIEKAVDQAIKENLLKMKVGTPEQIAQAQGLTLEKVL